MLIIVTITDVFWDVVERIIQECYKGGDKGNGFF